MRRWTLVLLLVMGVSAALLLTALGSRNLWFDEVPGVRIAQAPSIAVAFERYRDAQVQPPLYNVVLWIWTRVAGFSEGAVRLPFVLSAVGSVGLLALVGNRLLGRRAGLVAAYLVAVFPFFVLFGRMALYYAPTLFFTLACAYSLFRALDANVAGSAGRRWWTAHGFAVLALLLTNYTSAAYVVIEALFVFILVRRRLSLRDTTPQPRQVVRRFAVGWAISSAPVVLGLTAWLAADFTKTTGRTLGLRPGDIAGIPRLVLNAAYPLYAWTIGPTLFPWFPIAALGTVVVAITLVIGVRALAALRAEGLYVLLASFGTLLITAVVFQVYVQQRPFETVPTRAISAAPFAILAVVAGVDRLPRAAGFGALIVLSTVAGFGIANYVRAVDFHNPIYVVPSREIARSIERGLRPRDLVVAEADTLVPYYFSRRHTDQLGVVSFSDPETEGRMILRLRRERPDRVWYVELGRDGTRKLFSGRLRRWLNARYRVEDRHGYAPIDPTYRRLKERIQGEPSYRYKATVLLLVPRSG